tara:strand:- start:297 stop:677 length:381 start_codon:yes stop_codon:yes gene_type:complete
MHDKRYWVVLMESPSRYSIRVITEDMLSDHADFESDTIDEEIADALDFVEPAYILPDLQNAIQIVKANAAETDTLLIPDNIRMLMEVDEMDQQLAIQNAEKDLKAMLRLLEDLRNYEPKENYDEQD